MTGENKEEELVLEMEDSSLNSVEDGSAPEPESSGPGRSPEMQKPGPAPGLEGSGPALELVDADPVPELADTGRTVEKADTAEESVIGFVSLLMAGLRNALIYSPTHTQFNTALQLCARKGGELFTFVREITFVCIEKEVLFEGKPMNHVGVQFQKLGGFMNSLHMGRWTFRKGFTAKELKSFILGMVGLDAKGEPTGKRKIQATSHILFGKVKSGPRTGTLKLSHQAILNLLAQGAVSDEDIQKLKEGKKEPPTGEQGPEGTPAPEGETAAKLEAMARGAALNGAQGLMNGGGGGPSMGGEVLTKIDASLLNRAQDVLSKASSAQVANRVSVRETMMNFVHYYLKFTEHINALYCLKKHDEISFKHSINVGLLTAAQAQAMGMPTVRIQEVVLAGLFHDMGKLAIDPEILGKFGKLSETEKAQMESHPVTGAHILSQMTNAPRLAVLAAYEHHMHFSGTGGYPQRRRAKVPHLVSQMVGLADVYDSIRTPKPYRPALTLEQAVDILRQTAGDQFDPVLVQNFCKVLQKTE